MVGLNRATGFNRLDLDRLEERRRRLGRRPGLFAPCRRKLSGGGVDGQSTDHRKNHDFPSAPERVTQVDGDIRRLPWSQVGRNRRRSAFFGRNNDTRFLYFWVTGCFGHRFYPPGVVAMGVIGTAGTAVVASGGKGVPSGVGVSVSAARSWACRVASSVACASERALRVATVSRSG